ncbi:MAG: FAD:protein FMN transferase [Bacteroidales bacterium]|nr:FAD:protein FMN transferase [Bacteroidales bacterium]
MKISSFSLIVLLLLGCACNEDSGLKKIRFTGEAQGTYYAVTCFYSGERDLQPQVDSLLKAFDLSVSLWQPASVISRINANDPEVRPDDIFTRLFHLSAGVYRQSGGAFDPTVGPLVNAWGFGFSDRMKLDSATVDSLRSLKGFERLSLKNGQLLKEDPRIRIDFNAIAQGYSVDLLGRFLESQGIYNYLIDVGGEVLARGRKPDKSLWTVGIEKPSVEAAPERPLKAKVSLKDKALATSGNYRKFFMEDGIRYSHTIDPATGYPVRHSLLSATVVAAECATADAWATACMVAGLEKSKEMLNNAGNLEAYFIYSGENGELKTFFTEGFRKILLEEY